MFSSDNNSHPLYYHQSSSFANVVPESNNIVFEHHNLHHGQTNNYMMPPTYYPPISENPIFRLSSQQLINQDHPINYPLNVINHMSSTSRKTAVKKDRHTKICTAQGVRDRRVRLSMSIARQFFNLQDMLGFDKASETLGWLLAKSKDAIYELASTSSSNDVEPINVINGEEEENYDYEVANDKKDLNETSSLSTKRKKRGSNRIKVEFSDKEDKRREKARERARERTKMKKIVDDQNLLKSLNYHLQQRLQQDLMICDDSRSAATPSNETPCYGGFGKGVSSVAESVIIKGNKSRSGSSCNCNCNYEMMISPNNDQETCNDDYINNSSSESCNYGEIIQPPGLYPALNIINLSTEIHINGRPWDSFNNQMLH